jgi:hypothetical protein
MPVSAVNCSISGPMSSSLRPLYRVRASCSALAAGAPDESVPQAASRARAAAAAVLATHRRRRAERAAEGVRAGRAPRAAPDVLITTLLVFAVC